MAFRSILHFWFSKYLSFQKPTLEVKHISLLFYQKGKGDPMECGSYRGIKLLEHAVKVVERIFEHRIRQQIEIDDMQFGLMKGKGTTDAIFMARQMQENFRVKGKKLYFVLWIWRKLLIRCQEK